MDWSQLVAVASSMSTGHWAQQVLQPMHNVIFASSGSLS
jgi:hypothetical protein